VQPSELFEFFRVNLPYFAVPRYVEILDCLPRTPNMKVRKAELRERGVTTDTWDFETLGLTIARDDRRARIQSNGGQ
jgi:crotonobetaine/carnitine-CoA ligase